MGSAERRRGADAERAVVRYLRANGYPDARRYLAGDGRQPGDIDFHPLVCLEVKDRAASSWPTWCRQAAAEARPGMVPVVVRRARGVADVGLWECRYDPAAWAKALHNLHPYAELVVIDGREWMATTMYGLTNALRRFDAIDAAPSLDGER